MTARAHSHYYSTGARYWMASCLEHPTQWLAEGGTHYTSEAAAQEKADAHNAARHQGDATYDAFLQGRAYIEGNLGDPTSITVHPNHRTWSITCNLPDEQRPNGDARYDDEPDCQACVPAIAGGN